MSPIRATAALAPVIVAALLAACSSRPEAPQHEQEAANPDTPAVRAAKPGDVRNFTIGTYAAIALHDGGLRFPNDNKVFGVGRTPAEVAAVLGSAGLPTDSLEVSLQPLLVKTADRVLLFDTGAGANMGPNGGRLLTSMSEAGIAPAIVTDIFISHSHGDHVGGLVNAAGERAFPNATIHISAPEWAYLEGMTAEQAKANGIANHAALVAAMTPKVAAFAPDAEIVPGAVKAVAIKGHTPGHSGYLITSTRASLLYVGDTVHHFVVSVQKPQWPVAFDTDPAAAEASRQALLSDSAAQGQRLYAVHFPFPGIGKVQRQGDGFVWVKE
ncbi:MAG TPA: MBL fold metallo-hydrolase [Steroidobacteraceae bacterium]|nr:MBL fold metallo-hydrolase [Steroidobacteraceae bacterium]